MARGHISRLVRSQGYGFILQDDRLDELQFHWTAVTAGSLSQLVIGQRVEFDARPDPREEGRILAVNVRLAVEEKE